MKKKELDLILSNSHLLSAQGKEELIDMLKRKIDITYEVLFDLEKYDKLKEIVKTLRKALESE